MVILPTAGINLSGNKPDVERSNVKGQRKMKILKISFTTLDPKLVVLHYSFQKPISSFLFLNQCFESGFVTCHWLIQKSHLS